MGPSPYPRRYFMAGFGKAEGRELETICMTGWCLETKHWNIWSTFLTRNHIFVHLVCYTMKTIVSQCDVIIEYIDSTLNIILKEVPWVLIMANFSQLWRHVSTQLSFLSKTFLSWLFIKNDFFLRFFNWNETLIVIDFALKHWSGAFLVAHHTHITFFVLNIYLFSNPFWQVL